MLLKDDILKLETRREIYNLILNNPGLHLREIKRRTNVPLGSIQYHLSYLERYELIVSKTFGRFTRYYAKQIVGNKDKEILNLIRQETPRRIILMLLTPGPGHIFKDKKTQKKAYSKRSTFLKIYSKKEIIELTKHWKGNYDKDFYLNKHRTTIGFHLKKLLDADIIEKVKVGKEIKYKLKDEDLIWEIFIKYRNELSIKSINRMLIWQDDGYLRLLDRLTIVVLEIFPHPYYI